MATAKYDFNGKVAFVTGGASGIGEACIKQFSSNGASVVIADMNEKAGTALAKSINDKGGKALFIQLNVTNPEAAQKAIDQTVQHFGRIDYAVNCAGVTTESKLLADYSLEEWHRCIDVNLNGVFYCLRAQIPAMMKNGGGSIVNLSSIMGLVSSPTTPAYVAAKHAVAGLTKNAAQSYSNKGVRVNAICPGYIKTPMLMNSATEEIMAAGAALHPIGRMGEADEVAATALFLCSDAASFITGGLYPVDGGYLTN